jgi:hypothetical protein
MSTKESSYNPLCLTMIFMFGITIGAFVGHTSIDTFHDMVIIGLATIAFHLTQVKKLGLFLKKL